MDVLSLLRSKNKCLERFLELSKEFDGTFENLERFETRREATLKAIALYDRKIAEAATMLTPPFDHLKAAVEAEMARKEKLVHEILDVDLRIIGQIEELKNRLLQEVAVARKGREMLAKFRSTWVAESGEGLDDIL